MNDEPKCRQCEIQEAHPLYGDRCEDCYLTDVRDTSSGYRSRTDPTWHHSGDPSTLVRRGSRWHRKEFQ